MEYTKAANSASKLSLGLVRRFVTPEGVDLELKIATAGQRLGALLIDLIILVVIMFVLAFVLLSIVPVASDNLAMVFVVGNLAFFFLRVFWFASFEMSRHAATPGKRLLGIRVVARDGGRLTFSAIMARNFIRELEIFLPLHFMNSDVGESFLGAWANIAGFVWALSLSLFLLFNRDRMRLGDVLAGTWVVMNEKPKLQSDSATLHTTSQSAGAGGAGGAGNAIEFSDAELAVYGIYELQTLERIIRDKDKKTIRAVAGRIREKIGRRKAEDDYLFLTSYYTQLKPRLEKQMLLGKRRESKYDSE